MAKKNKSRKAKPTATLIRMPDELKAELDAAAVKSGLSLNEVMVRWLSAIRRLESQMERFNFNTSTPALSDYGLWLVQEALSLGLGSAALHDAESARRREVEGLVARSKGK
jgi:hypothetical protein